jgi:hypothetical protein
MITKFMQFFLLRRAALEDFLAQFPLLAPHHLPPLSDSSCSFKVVVTCRPKPAKRPVFHPWGRTARRARFPLDLRRTWRPRRVRTSSMRAVPGLGRGEKWVRIGQEPFQAPSVGEQATRLDVMATREVCSTIPCSGVRRLSSFSLGFLSCPLPLLPPSSDSSCSVKVVPACRPAPPTSAFLRPQGGTARRTRFPRDLRLTWRLHSIQTSTEKLYRGGEWWKAEPEVVPSCLRRRSSGLVGLNGCQ